MYNTLLYNYTLLETAEEGTVFIMSIQITNKN